METVINKLKKHAEGADLTLHQGSLRAPKPYDALDKKLFGDILTCGKDLGLSLDLKESGGVCDGNILGAEGMPVVDTLGVRGGSIHSDQEYILLDSLTERTKLAALFLMKLGAGEINYG